MRARFACPVWFAALVALAWRALAHALDLHALEGAELQLAWFSWLIPVASWIWAGLQAVGQVTLAALQYAVVSLWTFARSTFSALIGLGKSVVAFGQRAWGFLRGLYTDVLAPAWRKFWRFVDATRRLLDRIVRPVLRVLARIRHVVLDVYDRFVRPVLDTIDAVRRGLGVLSALGVEWARRLDAQLTRIQDWIRAPFLLVLRKLNEVVNVINRIVTADGLFQRLALIRSIGRDMRYVGNLWWHTFHRPLTDAEQAVYATPADPVVVAAFIPPLQEYLETGGGPDAARIEEAVADLRIRLMAL